DWPDNPLQPRHSAVREGVGVASGHSYLVLPVERAREPLAYEPAADFGEPVAGRAVTPFTHRHISWFAVGIAFVSAVLVHNRLTWKRHPCPTIEVKVNKAIIELQPAAETDRHEIEQRVPAHRPEREHAQLRLRHAAPRRGLAGAKLLSGRARRL